MTSPYRQASQSLLCPRCGEILDVVFSGVAACPRCQGAWIAQPTLDSAFGDPRWPKGHNMWWHDELECPECLLTGSSTKMSARGSGDVRVDACPSHGLWLDRGELSRLLGLEAGTDELLELQFRVTPSESDVEDLEERRRVWQSEREARGKAAAALRAELEELHERRAAEEAEAETQRRAERAAAEVTERARAAQDGQASASAKAAMDEERERAAEEARTAANVQAAAEVAMAGAKARADADARAGREALIRGYRAERNEIRQRITTLRIELTAGQRDLNVMQAELAAQHRAVSAKTAGVASVSAELDGLDARLQAIDSHLAREGS